ncbi:MAG TPA: PQQ-dependent sugar dehydrogenase [Solirubrobacterales bacterium]|nr:PQQ-dependent sugar dehydrogenase [Solirubrobacterales bacterium]
MAVIRAVGKLAVLVLAISAFASSSAQALTAQRIGSFQQPIYVTSAPANPDRLFVVEREGTIVVVENGEVKPFADIRSAVSCCTGERGLLSIALAPDFAQSNRLYLFYTGEKEPGELHVAEMVANGATAPTSSLRDVIPPIPHKANSNHNGGQLQFGRDGALYASTGDGGGKDDELHNAQDPSSLLGKILRIVPEPAATVTPTIWSLGLRNPFRFSFDRQTGDLWIGDVGQDKREEVDFAAAPAIGQNANFGWNCFEGSLPGPATDPECSSPPLGGYVLPVFEYDNPEPGCAAIIGGYVARDPGFGEAFGRYLYGDNCVGDVRSLSPTAPFATDRYEGVHVDGLDSFGEDSCGRLYAVSRAGPLFRLLGSSTTTCGDSDTTTIPTLAASHIDVRAATRKVKRNRRAFISAWVSPCNGRRSGQVTLWRGRRNLGTRRLDQVCSARFRPRIGRRSSFRVTVKADQTFAGAISRRLTIRPVRHLKR